MTDTIKEIAQSKSDDELLKMVYQIDEWSPEMLSEVAKELSKRNILPNDVEQRKQHLIGVEEANLSQGRDASLFGLIIGWITVFGLLGVAIGYNYAFTKRKSRYTAKQYFKYNEASRKNGSYLFYTSLLLTGVAILYKTIIAS